MQLALGKQYFMFDPKSLHNRVRTLLIQRIVANPSVVKVLHGAESLDIPYICQGLLRNDRGLIVRFFAGFQDTLYGCELLRHGRPGIGCNLYALLDALNVVSPRALQQLRDNERTLGALWKKRIDVRRLTPELVTYAIHDVVFLETAFQRLQQELERTERGVLPLLNQVCVSRLLHKQGLFRSVDEARPAKDAGKVANAIAEWLDGRSRLRRVLLVGFAKRWLLRLLTTAVTADTALLGDLQKNGMRELAAEIKLLLQHVARHRI